MLQITISKDPTKLQKQIKALEYQLRHDTNDKDKQIHQQALEQLKQALN